MTITMTELAKRLNLSQSTVSLVLNNRDKKRVRPELADRIRAAAKEVGFRPNRAAGELRRRQSRDIGVLLPSPRNFYYAELVADLHHAIVRRGYAPVFAFWETDREAPEAVESALSWNPAALITVEPALVPRTLDRPAVSFYREDPRFDCVKLDLEAAVRMTLDHLRNLGHRTLAWLGAPDEERLPLLKRLAPAYGFELRPEWMVFRSGNIDFAEGRAMGGEFVRRAARGRPTAVMAHNDTAALAVMRRLREAGLRIPGDVSLVGHDDVQQGEHATPSLTTVRYAAPVPLGDFLVETLFRRLADPGAPRAVHRMAPELVVRESSGPAAPSGGRPEVLFASPD